MDTTPPPISCTLTTMELAQRTLQWSDLAPIALARTEIDNGVRSTYPLDMAGPIERLATAERDCCGSWLDISVRRSDVLELELTSTNADGLGIIRRMSGLT